MTEIVRVIKIRNNSREEIDESVVREVPLTFIANGKELVTILCCPLNLDDLVRGFLFTSGLIKNIQEIKRIIISQEQWIAYIDFVDVDKLTDLVFKRLYTSGCGRGTLFYNVHDIINRSKITSDFKVESVKIHKLMLEFQKKSEVYIKTGGVHSAALTDDSNILIFREDIGRHNAIDKVIGCGLNQCSDIENKILISSGRISSEVIFKIQKCKIPMVVSKSAPTDQAIKLSKEMNITLVGFARANTMNVYSCDERVK